VLTVGMALPQYGARTSPKGQYDNLTKTVPTGQTGTTWAPSYNTANNTFTTATYDSNGNLLTDTFHTYTWNQDNHPKSIDGTAATMTYDAAGRMVEKYDGHNYYPGTPPSECHMLFPSVVPATGWPPRAPKAPRSNISNELRYIQGLALFAFQNNVEVSPHRTSEFLFHFPNRLYFSVDSAADWTQNALVTSAPVAFRASP